MLAQIVKICSLIIFISINPLIINANESDPIKLIKLAQNDYGKLTKADSIFLNAVALGIPAVYQTGDTIKDSPKNSDEWGIERTFDSNIIHWLIYTDKARVFINKRGIIIEGAKILGPLVLFNVKLEYPLWLNNCVFKNDINFYGSEIQEISLNGSQCKAIDFSNMIIDKSILLRDGFKCEGGIKLIGSNIGNDISLKNGVVNNTVNNSVFADRVYVGGSIFLNHGFKSYGQVKITSANIKGSIECTDAEFHNPKAKAINFRNTCIGNNLFIKLGTKINGEISLLGTTVEGEFHFYSIDRCSELQLDMRRARINTIWDDTLSINKCYSIYLNGLDYNYLHKADITSNFRINNWLHKQPKDSFYSQPYEKLASYYFNIGKNGDAQKVLIEKNKDYRKYAQLTFLEKIWNFTLEITIGYGYRPWYALIWSASMILLGSIIFYLADKKQLMVYINSENESSKCLIFSPIMYSIDLFIPLIDFYQAKYWLPDISNKKIKIGCFRAALFIRVWLWFQISMGWILTLFLVAGLSGLVKK